MQRERHLIDSRESWSKATQMSWEAAGATDPQGLPRRPPSRSNAVAEFLFTGGFTALLFPLAWLLRRWLGLDLAEYWVGFSMFYAAYLVNDPHFAASYLLFYADARARASGRVFSRKQTTLYWLAGFVAPVGLVLWAWAALAFSSAPLLGMLVQCMFFFVGFHYTKQGFGLMIVLSARRGVLFSVPERRAILAHCLAGWAFAWATPVAPRLLVEDKGVVFLRWSRPLLLSHVALLALVASTLWLSVVLFRKWRRERVKVVSTPLTALLASVWAWSIFSSLDPLVRYAVPALHSLQYLWMVQLLKSNEAQALTEPPHFQMNPRVRLMIFACSAVALGFVLFHVVGQVLDGALVSKRERIADLGPTRYFAAIYAVINLHHYAMDAVIWRRDNPKTRYLRV
jgi:hypothetical protein